MHLSSELLSAYLDGELTPAESMAAAAHVRSCADCAGTARLYAALDERLAAVPALACSAALTLVSAELDGELAGEESTIAAAHLAACAGCRANVLRWSVVDRSLAALPAARPSVRVDQAIAALGRRPAARVPRFGLGWPAPALAVAVAMSIVMLLVIGNGTVPAVPNTALVAAAQLSVLNPKTGTLYVLHPESGTVAALNATTMQQVSLISVGGRPTALALNETTNAIVVLDAGAKTLTFIDGTLNTVSSSAEVTVPGTPTGLQVDPAGHLVVSSVPAGGGAASAKPATGGTVSVISADAKQVVSVKQVDVAPQVMVLEPNGRRALLVSAEATTLVDATTYEPLKRATGGMAAAFAVSGDDFAILSRTATGATVSFARRTASVAIAGTPHAIAPLPDGGFAVLSDVGARGRITLLLPDGSPAGTFDVAANGRDLTYDAALRQFTIIGAASATTVPLPLEFATIPGPAPRPDLAASPLPTLSPTPVPSVTPTPLPSHTPESAAPAVIAARSLAPQNGRVAWPGTYIVSLGSGHGIVASAGDGERLWFVDGANRLNAFHMLSGQRFPIAQLPAGANVTRIVISPNHVYLADSAGVLYVLTIASEQLVTVQLPMLAAATAIAASPDERLWLATNRFGLVSFDPRTGRLETIAAGPDLSAVAVDALGRVWVAAGERQAIDSYDTLTGTLTELVLAHDGAITALFVDRAGAVWLGTDRGSTFALRNDRVESVQAIGAKVAAIVAGPEGGAWYVGRNASDVISGPLGGSGGARYAPGSASGPTFDALGRSWQVDRSADQVYVTLPEAQP